MYRWKHVVYHGREIRRDFFNIYIYKNSKYKTKGGRFCLAVDYTKSTLTFKRVLTPNLNSCTRERERESLCVCVRARKKKACVVWCNRKISTDQMLDERFNLSTFHSRTFSSAFNSAHHFSKCCCPYGASFAHNAVPSASQSAGAASSDPNRRPGGADMTISFP